MRLILVLLTAFGVTATSYAVFKITETWAPLVWVATKVLLGGEFVAHRLMRAARDTDTIVFKVGCWLDHWFDVDRWHDTAVMAGSVDYRCAELAPGWWDFHLDCAGHECGACEACTGLVWPSNGHRSSHTV